MIPSAPPAPISLRRPGIRAWLDPSHPNASALSEHLESIVAIPSSFTPIPTRSRSRRVWEGHIDDIPYPVVIKQGWVSPTYPLDRRIARRVSFVCHNPFRHALGNSIRLATADFPSARPILCWKKYSGLFPIEEGILYPKIEASGSLLRYLDDPATGNHFDRRLRLPSETLAALARFLRTLNAAGFVHLDPTPQNILLRPGAADPPTEADFILIDVESFRPLSSSPTSPRSRYARATALSPLVPHIPSADFPLFAAHYALPSESPAAWIPLLDLLHRTPHLLHPSRLSSRLALLRLARSF